MLFSAFLVTNSQHNIPNIAFPSNPDLEIVNGETFCSMLTLDMIQEVNYMELLFSLSIPLLLRSAVPISDHASAVSPVPLLLCDSRQIPSLVITSGLPVLFACCPACLRYCTGTCEKPGNILSSEEECRNHSWPSHVCSAF